MGLVNIIRSELERQSHARKWEKELLEKIANTYGKETAIQIKQELKPTKKGSTYHTYVSRINMVYQFLLKGEKLEDAITKAKNY